MTVPSGPPGPAAHATPEELALHAEGLLAGAEEAGLAAHVAACPACQAVQADLVALRAALAADRPGPVPAEVAGRIDAALAELSPPVPERRTAVVDLLKRRRTRYRRFTRLAGAAAGLVLVVGGSVLGVQLARDGDPISAAGGRGSPAAGLAEDSGPSLATAPEAGREFSASSGRAYDRAGFAGQIAALLRSGTGQAPAGEAPGGGAADRAVGGTACTARLAQQTGSPGTEPIAVDVATWEGDPAIVVVLPEPGAATTVHAYVLPRDCAGQAAAPVPILHDAVLPRP
jgi:hypothetical protein